MWRKQGESDVYKAKVIGITNFFFVKNWNNKFLKIQMILSVLLLSVNSFFYYTGWVLINLTLSESLNVGLKYLHLQAILISYRLGHSNSLNLAVYYAIHYYKAVICHLLEKIWPMVMGCSVSDIITKFSKFLVGTLVACQLRHALHSTFKN